MTRNGRAGIPSLDCLYPKPKLCPTSQEWHSGYFSLGWQSSDCLSVRQCSKCEHRVFLTLQVFKQPWPGIMRTVYGNHERFEATYFKKFPGYYVTGDGEPWLTPFHTSHQDMCIPLSLSRRASQGCVLCISLISSQSYREDREIGNERCTVSSEI